MAHHRLASTSSYDPVLIRPTPLSPKSARSALVSPTTQTPRLKYPYPLPILSLVDLGYTIHSTTRQTISGHFILLSIGRMAVLCGAVGASNKWRFRGGWIAGTSGVTALASVWEVCKDRLDPSNVQRTDTTFLVLTALLAILEYLLFLLLLRLSPPPHRLNPLSLRLPRSAIQTPTAFHYSADPDPDEADTDYSPTASPTRRRIVHDRYASVRTTRSASTYLGDQDEDGDEEELLDPEDEDGGDMVDDDSASSISDSSIIDLPPAQDPARIVPPPSLSMANLNAILNEEAPVIGPLVRRTRSARLLARSWGREGVLADAMGGSYGTFGVRGGQPQAQSSAE